MSDTALRTTMKLKGFTYRELAERTGINKKTLESYGIGHRPIDKAPIKDLVRISSALHVPVSEIIEDEETKKLLKTADF